MFSALRKLPQVASRRIPLTRNIYAYPGPPREKLSIVETWAHTLAICGGILAIPIWVITHVREYRGLDNPNASE